MSGVNPITIKDARIIYRNFRGEGSQFNPKGKRNFSIVFTDSELVNDLIEDGWKLKPLKQRDEDDEPAWQMPVEVKYRDMAGNEVRPPEVYICTYPNGKLKKTRLTEETIGMLDFAEISNVDLVVRPYEWEMNGSTGIKAYLKAMYVTVVEDELADKYAEED